MKCPQCSMENGPDSVHCEFCHEKLRGQSAAETYLQHMRRARSRDSNGEWIDNPAASAATDPAPAAAPRRPPADLQLGRHAGTFLRSYWRPIAMLAAGLAAFLFIETALTPANRFHYLGTPLLYGFARNKPVSYIVGFTTEARRWSERSGQMDTPLGDLKVEDIGTVNVALAAESTRDAPEVAVTSNNWLINIHRQAGLESHSLAAMPALLAPAHLWFDGHGRLTRRQQGSSIRIAKSAQFIAPAFPAGHIRAGQRWTDTAEWTDAIDGWTVHWAVKRDWRADQPIACGDDACFRLTYDATLIPTITSEPHWMAHAQWDAASMRGAGELVFDTTAHYVVSHVLSYDGNLRAHIANLAAIPDELRVGLRAFPIPGEIIFELKNHAALQRN